MTRYEQLAQLVLLAMTMGALVPTVCYSEPSKKHRDPSKIAYPSDVTVEWDCRILHPGKSLEKLFGEAWIDVARFNRIDRRHARSGLSIKVPKRLEDLASFTPLPLFYPVAERDEQFILIDLTEQFLGTYEYGALRFATPIASGNGLDETPTRKFRLTAISRKIPAGDTDRDP